MRESGTPWGLDIDRRPLPCKLKRFADKEARFDFSIQCHPLTNGFRISDSCSPQNGTRQGCMASRLFSRSAGGEVGLVIWSSAGAEHPSSVKGNNPPRNLSDTQSSRGRSDISRCGGMLLAIAAPSGESNATVKNPAEHVGPGPKNVHISRSAGSQDPRAHDR